MVTSRRSSVDIMGEILRLGEANKTRVMYGVNMSHSQMKAYLQFMTEKGLLERRKNTKGRHVYAATSDGLGLLHHIDQIQLAVGPDDDEVPCERGETAANRSMVVEVAGRLA